MNAQEDDQEGVERSDRGGEREQAGHDRGYVGRVPLDQAGGEAGDQADQGADREIDAAGEDDAGLSDGDKSEVGRLFVDVQEVGEPGKTIGEHATDGKKKEKQDDDADQTGVVAQARLQDGARHHLGGPARTSRGA